MKPKVAILGKGNVGQALGEAFQAAGYEVRYGTRRPDASVPEAAAWGDVVVLAVPYGAVPDVVRTAGDALDDKVLLDATNALTPSYELAVGHTTSAAEELQKIAPRARVVKAFNTVFAENMRTGKVGDEQLTTFVAGDDADAKEQALAMARDIGFDAVDAGPLKSARYLEPLAMLLITLGYGMEMGAAIGFRLVRA